ncbi:MAG: hypothetical protein LBG60_16700 [Bifidobacteriaceae bacterium]|nr:hypothetical protein [Bifidobacteriaceae bacterium]
MSGRDHTDQASGNQATDEAVAEAVGIAAASYSAWAEFWAQTADDRPIGRPRWRLRAPRRRPFHRPVPAGRVGSGQGQEAEAMTQTAPALAGPPAMWEDPRIVEDVVLYDMARHQASVLSALLLERARATAGDYGRDHWEARRRLVRRQAEALDVDDRAGLIAQHQAWACEIRALAGPA